MQTNCSTINTITAEGAIIAFKLAITISSRIPVFCRAIFVENDAKEAKFVKDLNRIQTMFI